MNWILIILGLDIIAIAVIYILLKRRIDNAVRSTELLSQIELEIDKIVTELNLTTDRNITLVEDRIRNLNLLLEQADRKMVLMSKEAESRKNETVVYSRPRPVIRAVEEVTGSIAVPENELQVTEKVPLEYEETPVKVDFNGRLTPPVQERPKTSSEKVLEMYTDGEDVNIIASKLSITLGEIELILSMNGIKASER